MRITLDFATATQCTAFMAECQRRKATPLFEALFTGEAYQGPSIARVVIPYNEGGMQAMMLAAAEFTPVQITVA